MSPQYRYGRGGGNLFDEMEQLRREIGRLFSDWTAAWPEGRMEGTVPVNLYAGADEVVLTTELPGIAPEALDLRVEEKTLTLSFARPEEKLAEGARYQRRERPTGRFTRVVELPFRVEDDRVEARVERGILQVRLPRRQEDRPRRINIQTT